MTRTVRTRWAAALTADGLPFGRRLGLGLLSLVVGLAVWLPAIHFLFDPGPDEFLAERGVPPRAQALAARHLRLWSDPTLRQYEIQRMRVSNPEWDFMARTFLALSLAEIALRDPAERPRCLAAMDAIIDETVRIEREKGHLFFLMGYATATPFVRKPARSLFVDGEIALMVGARRLVEEKEEYRAILAEHAGAAFEGMRVGPVLCAESYPDECWMFCNATALAALQIQDVLDGTDRRDFFRDWLEMAHRKLVDPRTGLLVSKFTLRGDVGDGPEGSSIWMTAYGLSFINEAFARDQYDRARREIGRTLLGFGYAIEWPQSWPGPGDIDSGPIVPVLGASAGSSGLALLGAAAFGDREFHRCLSASLGFAAFPIKDRYGLRYAASNTVGDAVMLCSTVLGPLRDAVKARRKP